MSTCQCHSMKHNHVAGECPNDESAGGTRPEERNWCQLCRDKANLIRLAGILDLPVATGTPPDLDFENLIVPEKPDQ
jgi:hypothetical protein